MIHTRNQNSGNNQNTPESKDLASKDVVVLQGQVGFSLVAPAIQDVCDAAPVLGPPLLNPPLRRCMQLHGAKKGQ